MTSHLVVFTPSGKRGRFETGTPILEAARELGVYVESVCGGRATCGRCQVEPQFGNFAKHSITSACKNISEPGPKETRYDEVRGLANLRRLSCSATVQGDLVIDIPADAAVNRQVVRKNADSKVFDRNPALTLCYVEVEEPDMHKPLGDLDRLQAALREQWGFADVACDAHLLTMLQTTLRKGDWKVTAAVHQPRNGGAAQIVAVYPGLKNEAYGIACDIGSTTIAL
ncbi:MAG: drug:proton antiporter, partial [Pseudomonadota bacterium]